VNNLGQHQAGLRTRRRRMHGGKSPGAPKGNKNAFRHGRYISSPMVTAKPMKSVKRSAIFFRDD
jgi:hypothetical protein